MFEVQKFDFRIQAIAIFFAIALVVGVVELVRRRQLGEACSIVWLVLSAIVAMFALFRNLQEIIADFIGVYYPPSLIFGALIFMLFGLVLYLSTVVTRLETHTRILTQRLALLEHHIFDSSENKIDDEPEKN